MAKIVFADSGKDYDVVFEVVKVLSDVENNSEVAWQFSCGTDENPTEFVVAMSKNDLEKLYRGIFDAINSEG